MKTIKVRKLSGLWEKTRGLIGRDDINAVLFETRWGIHTYFLNNPIQVLILDKNSIVQSIKVMNPNRLFFWNPQYSRVVEITGSRKQHFSNGEKIKLVIDNL